MLWSARVNGTLVVSRSWRDAGQSADSEERMLAEKLKAENANLKGQLDTCLL